MARKQRIHYPGAVYHVIFRGNAGQDIFLNDADRNHFYRLLEDGTDRFGYRIHAFCLMPNHAHLAVQVNHLPLSKGMQNLSFRYTQGFNFRHNRVGHLFQGRYKAIVVEQERYLHELTRYIHLNPVRAGLVEGPDSFAWSSYSAYLGDLKLPWPATAWVLSQFADSELEARKRYEAFVLDGLEEGYRADFHKGSMDARILGDDKFLEKCLEGVVNPDSGQSIAKISETVVKEYGLNPEVLSSPSQKREIAEARAVIGWLVRELDCGTFTAVGELFNRDISSVSSAVRRLEVRLSKDKGLMKRVMQLKMSLADKS